MAWHQTHIRKRVLDQVLGRVFEQTHIPATRILSPERTPHVVAARDELIRQLHAADIYSLTEIGRVTGRDHSSVHHALHKAPKRMRWNRPHIWHLRCRGCKHCTIEKPEAPPLLPPPPIVVDPRRYLIPYAGADARYVLKARSP